MMNGMFSIDSFVATRRGRFLNAYRGQTSTAKFGTSLRDSRRKHVSATAEIADLRAELNMKIDARGGRRRS